MIKRNSKKKVVIDDTTENVRIKSTTVEKVRENKKSTGINVGTFFELAAEEKLSKTKK